MVQTQVQVGPDHIIGDVIHVQILRDTTQSDPQHAFSAKINAPGFSQTMQIANGASETYDIPGIVISGVPVTPTVQVVVNNFQLLPAGATPKSATALSFLLVFKIREIFLVTIGSIQVTASLK